jgi:archaemetzincin
MMHNALKKTSRSKPGQVAALVLSSLVLSSLLGASNSLANDSDPSPAITPAPAVVATFEVAGRDQPDRQTGDAPRLIPTIVKLRKLHQPLPEARPGDWLAEHDEPGQTFREYLRSRPVTPVGSRFAIYVQPIGEFSTEQRTIVRLASEYLSIFMNRPVKVLMDLPLSVVPPEARRKHPNWGVPQIKTSYILHQVLKPRLPDDAAACIAFTASDLWPKQGWNFVFGQASLRDRVGVWSVYRNGDPAKSAAAFRTCLRRTLRTASHETGHMFSILHCTAYQCNMSGSNSRAESDRHPLYLCPECHAKICWATGTDPLERCRLLSKFCRKHRLDGEHTYYQKAIAALEQ